MSTATTAPRLEGMLVPRRPPSNRGTVIGDAFLGIGDETQVFLCNNWGRLSYAGRVVDAVLSDAGLGVSVAFDSGDPIPGDIAHGKADVWVRLCPVRKKGHTVWQADSTFYADHPYEREGHQVVAICLGYDPGGWDSWSDVRLTRDVSWTD